MHWVEGVGGRRERGGVSEARVLFGVGATFYRDVSLVNLLLHHMPLYHCHVHVNSCSHYLLFFISIIFMCIFIDFDL